MKKIFTILFLFLTMTSSAFAADMDLAWSKQYDSLSGFCIFITCDVARAVVADSTGVYYGGLGVDNLQKRDLATGNLIWSTSTGSGYIVMALATDNTGVYVGAIAWGAVTWEWRIQKVDKNSGIPIWTQSVSSFTPNNPDWIYGVCVDGNGVYVVGSDGEGLSSSFRIEKRSLVDGSLVWRETEGFGSVYAKVVSCALSSDGNSLYITGGFDQWRTEKRNTSNGDLVWQNTSSFGSFSQVSNIEVDNTGVYVGGARGTGASTAKRRLEKMNLSDGSPVWSKEEGGILTSGGNQRLTSYNGILYRLGVTAGGGSSLFFERINPVNGNTIDILNFASTVRDDYLMPFDASFFGGKFYFAGNSSILSKSWGMEKRDLFIAPPPDASIIDPAINITVTQNQPVAFSGTGTGVNPTIAYEWREGNCSTGTLLSTALNFNLPTPAVSAGRTIYLRVKDSLGTWSTNCPSRVVTVTPANTAPVAPTVSGSTTTNVNTTQTYTFTATDTEGNQIRYGIDWDMDSVADEWLPAGVSYVNSGTAQSTSHSWSTSGNKTFQALAQDAPGVNSAWTSYTVTVASPINGSCGSSHLSTFSTTPTTNLCTAGNASAVAGPVTGPWTWSCNGTNGGTNASCSAFTNVVAGVCGSANGTPVPTKPTTNLCAAGNASSVTGPGPWNWNCNGTNGGTNASCNAPKSTACGDSVCQITESILTCPIDCKAKVKEF